MKHKKSRRQFAKSILGWGALASASAGGFSDERIPLEKALQDIFRKKDSALAIGREYLANAAHEEDAAAILDSLAIALSVGPQHLISLETARALLRNRISEDFRSGNTVSVKGWVLSLTEARACAFLALAHSA